MKNNTTVTRIGLGLASAVLLSLGTAQATPIGPSGLTIELGGEACIAATCADLATAGYTVSGGAVLNDTVPNVARKPGEDTGNDGAVSSFNVTSSNDNPVGAIDLIAVTGLNSTFDFYWGSVDSYNVVEFFFMGTSVETFNGAQLAVLLGNESEPNFDTDQYVSFAAGDSNASFDRVELSSSGGVAFEVAAAVPEPATLALMGLGLLGMGVSSRHRNKS